MALPDTLMHDGLPRYDGGSLLNLMASIGAACGGRLPYAPLAGVDTTAWRQARNLVLILADGVGADFLAERSPDGFLHRHQVATLTSVCPTTTAAAIPTVMSGLPPAAHGLTGWHVYLDEIDAVTAVLPMTVRGARRSAGVPIDPAALSPHATFYGRLARPSQLVVPVELANSPFSQRHSRGATRHPYFPTDYPIADDMPNERRRLDLFGVLRRLCHTPGEPRFIYAYWPDYDHEAHLGGLAGKPALAAFRSFEAGLEEFVDSIRGTDTQVLVTADHGFMDSPPARQIRLADHPELAAMLVRPLSGERRFAYCSVKPGFAHAFGHYIEHHFKGRIEAWPSVRLLDEGWFGPGPVHPKLASRVGDYVLVMMGDWTIVDYVPGERPFPLIGMHGGLSRREMRIPLCAIAA
jgi:hypothetical protein